jgi:hypothetical protein
MPCNPASQSLTSEGKYVSLEMPSSLPQPLLSSSEPEAKTNDSKASQSTSAAVETIETVEPGWKVRLFFCFSWMALWFGLAAPVCYGIKSWLKQCAWWCGLSFCVWYIATIFLSYFMVRALLPQHLRDYFDDKEIFKIRCFQ